MTTNNKHTPSPWRLRANPYPDGKPYFHIEAGRGCSVDGFAIAGILQEADAKLMTAAPLMAEALKKIVRPSGCGCVPCHGQCTSKEALEIEIEEFKSIALECLKAAGLNDENEGV